MIKKTVYAALALVCALVCVSCQETEKGKDVCLTVGFEKAVLDSTGCFRGEFYSEENLSFTSYEIDSCGYIYWAGFVVNNHCDTVTGDYTNEYSAITGCAADGKQYATLYWSYYDVSGGKDCHMQFGQNEEHVVKSMCVTNTTYVYKALRDGSSFSKKFGEGDWFKVVLTAYDANGLETGHLDYYLADFRNGKRFLSDSWETVDLSSLGELNKLVFTFESSDTGVFGINTPTYVSIDNIVYVEKFLAE